MENGEPKCKSSFTSSFSHNSIILPPLTLLNSKIPDNNPSKKKSRSKALSLTLSHTQKRFSSFFFASAAVTTAAASKSITTFFYTIFVVIFCKYSKMLQANDGWHGIRGEEGYWVRAILFICIRHTPHQFSLLITVTWGQNHFFFWLLLLLLLLLDNREGGEEKKK